MNKARPVYHSGMAVVQLSELPLPQYDFLLKYVSSNSLINISTHGEEEEICIPYEVYENCYEVVHTCHYDHYFDSQI